MTNGRLEPREKIEKEKKEKAYPSISKYAAAREQQFVDEQEYVDEQESYDQDLAPDQDLAHDQDLALDQDLAHDQDLAPDQDLAHDQDLASDRRPMTKTLHQRPTYLEEIANDPIKITEAIAYLMHRKEEMKHQAAPHAAKRASSHQEEATSQSKLNKSSYTEADSGHSQARGDKRKGKVDDGDARKKDARRKSTRREQPTRPSQGKHEAHGDDRDRSNARSDGLPPIEPSRSHAVEQHHRAEAATPELARMKRMIEDLQAQVATRGRKSDEWTAHASPLSPDILKEPVQRTLRSWVCSTYVLASIGTSIAQDRFTIGDPQGKEETEHQASKPDVSGQPTTSGVKEGEINLRPQKGPKRVDANIAGVKSFGSSTIHGRACSRGWNLMRHILSLMCLENIHVCGHLKEPTQILSTGGTSSEPLPQYEQLHQDFEKSQNYQTGSVMPSKNHGTTTPLKREDELEIKFITVASEDMTNSIQYPSFHFMKLQRPDHRTSNYIKTQETKPELVVNLTEDEVSTIRA
ncbi:hypothetical protein ACS0TY_003369 [Phlomoides rotata]